MQLTLICQCVFKISFSSYCPVDQSISHFIHVSSFRLQVYIRTKSVPIYIGLLARFKSICIFNHFCASFKFFLCISSNIKSNLIWCIYLFEILLFHNEKCCLRLKILKESFNTFLLATVDTKSQDLNSFLLSLIFMHSCGICISYIGRNAVLRIVAVWVLWLGLF